MADTTTDLAQTGDNDVLSASELLDILNTPLGAAAQNASVVPSKTQAVEPVKLTIAGEELTPAQIEAKLEATKATVLASVQDRLGIADAFLALPEDQRQVLVATAEKLRQGINPLEEGTRELAVRPIDVPADARPPKAVDWDELSDEGKYVYALVSGMYGDLEGKLKDLSNIVAGMQQFVGSLHSKSQDQQMAEAMALKGFTGCTAADIAGWRAKGISDPLKAAENGILKPEAPKAEAKKEEAPPEATKGGSQKFYDSNTPGLTMDQELRLIKAGYLPSDPKKRAALLKERSKTA